MLVEVIKYTKGRKNKWCIYYSVKNTVNSLNEYVDIGLYKSLNCNVRQYSKDGKVYKISVIEPNRQFKTDIIIIQD